MPPPIKHDACVIVFDLNVSLDFFIKAKEYLLDIYANKWCSESKDYVCLLPFGTKVRGNDEAVIFCNYKPMDVKETIPDSVQDNDGRILKILLEAANILEKRHVSTKGLYSRQLLCISDFTKSNFSTEDEIIFEKLVSKLNNMKAFLYIVGPEVDNEKMLMNWRDVREFIQNSSVENEMLKRLKETVDRSVICGLKMGFILFSYFKRWAGPQPCLLPLNLGENRISFTNRHVRCLKKLSFMKFSENPYGRNYTYVLAENPEIEVEFDNIVNAIYVCGKYVTMPKDVRNSFKCLGERFFDILGFAKRSEVPAYLFVGDGTYKMVPSGLHDDWTVGLIRVLKEKDMVGITAQRVIRDTKQKFWALLPSDDCRFFYKVQLPFGNCMYKKYVQTNKSLKSIGTVDPIHEKGIYEYLDSMELTKDDLPVNLTITHNPQFQRWCRFVVQKYTGLEMNCEEVVLGKPFVSEEPLQRFWIERELETNADHH